MTLNGSANEHSRNEKKLLILDQSKPVIPAWLIWIQCIAFVVLYAVWILPEIVGFRNTALVVGALAGLYPIYQYRAALWTKRAIPIWLIVALFAWATFHLFFLSQDYAAQFLEYKRIWKYAAIGAVFAVGLALSLVEVSLLKKVNLTSCQKWGIIYLGLCMPVIIYMLKYILSTYGISFGISVPDYLKVYSSSDRYYIPKTDYVAFCLPTLAVTLGQIHCLLQIQSRLELKDYFWFSIYLGVIAAILFLFYMQDIKNGMAYSTICIGLFIILSLCWGSHYPLLKKLFWVGLGCLIFGYVIYQHLQKNDSWRTLAADASIALETERYQHWKYAGSNGYPNNEFGKMTSPTNYDRIAWMNVGSQLAAQNPLGYGLVEDSFKWMAKRRWPEVSPNLSHSHSGWLDVILAVGFPGFFFIISSMIFSIAQSREVQLPWRTMIVCGLAAQVLLWITTEVSATVTFAALIFWIFLSAGLVVIKRNRGYEKINLG